MGQLPLTKLENQSTSKLWAGGSSPPGRANLNRLQFARFAISKSLCNQWGERKAHRQLLFGSHGDGADDGRVGRWSHALPRLDAARCHPGATRNGGADDPCGSRRRTGPKGLQVAERSLPPGLDGGPRSGAAGLAAAGRGLPARSAPAPQTRQRRKIDERGVGPFDLTPYPICG